MKHHASPKPLNRGSRIEPLAVLPIFLDLHGKGAIVIGESEGALWKAELLLQCGAHVQLISNHPTAAMLQLVSDANGGADLVLADWRNVSFGVAAIVVADVCDADAMFVTKKAHTAGAWVNIVDKPEFCQFQFGSIVNKSPLVIGISTAGAAPVLAQYVRSLVEAVLPQGVQERAQKAAKIRSKVNGRLPNAQSRREYWKAFFTKVFGHKARPQKANNLVHVIKVFSVEELTLRDIKALQSADHIDICAQSDPAILNFARREATRSSISNDNHTEILSIAGQRRVVVQVHMGKNAALCL